MIYNLKSLLLINKKSAVSALCLLPDYGETCTYGFIKSIRQYFEDSEQRPQKVVEESCLTLDHIYMI